MRSTRRTEAIKEANGGEIPNGLYLQNSKRLRELIFDLTGEQRPETDSIKTLATLVEDAIQQIPIVVPVESESSWANKRKADEISPAAEPKTGENATTAAVVPEQPEEPQPKTTKKGKIIKPRWAVETLDALQIAEMKRILFVDTQTLYDRYQAGDLMQMWDYMGSKYPYPTGWEVSKYDNIEKMKLFARRNLLYHNVVNVTRAVVDLI